MCQPFARGELDRAVKPDNAPPQSAPLDNEGFLQNLADWNPDVAAHLAADSGIKLTDDHWQLIHLVREFHARTDVVPAMRPLVKLAQESLGAEHGNSTHINLLFPNGAAKSLARIAGLPKPTNCL